MKYSLAQTISNGCVTLRSLQSDNQYC